MRPSTSCTSTVTTFASVVGLIVLPIFGYQDEAARVPPRRAGIAFNSTNILRDVKEDAQLGRVYLPREDLEQFGVYENDLMTGRVTPQFLELMKFETDRAREFHQRRNRCWG